MMNLTELVTQCRRLGVAIMYLQVNFYEDVFSSWYVSAEVTKDEKTRTVEAEHTMLMRAVWDVANQLAEEYGEVE